MVKEKEESHRIKKEISLITFSLLFAIFFGLKIFHNWSNSIMIKLHFCDHFFCIIYSLIWLTFGTYNLFYFFKESDKGGKSKRFKIQIIIFSLILIIGIVLMNITFCNSDGKIIPGFENQVIEINEEFERKDSDKKDYSGDIPFSEDEPFYPDGTIKPNTCLDNLTLREYQLDSYGGILVNEFNCAEVYGPNSCCSDGECVLDCFEEIVSCEVFFEIYSGRENYGFAQNYINKCSIVAESHCETGVEWDYEHFDSEKLCCVWKCLEKLPEPTPLPPPEPPEKNCEDVETGLIHETATCYDGGYYSDYCEDKLTLIKYRCFGNSCVGEPFQCNLFCDEINNECK